MFIVFMKLTNCNFFNFFRNTRRIAETWFGDYKQLYYSIRPESKNIEYGSIKKTNALKERLQCRSIDWFLQNIFQELKYTINKKFLFTKCIFKFNFSNRITNIEYSAFGDIKHAGKCLQIYRKHKYNDWKLGLGNCNEQPNTINADLLSNKWTLNKFGRLKHDNGLCLNVANGKHIIVEKCQSDNRNQLWERNRGLLLHTISGLCLENLLNTVVGLSKCRPYAYSQFWSFSIEIEQL